MGDTDSEAPRARKLLGVFVGVLMLVGIFAAGMYCNGDFDQTPHHTAGSP